MSRRFSNVVSLSNHPQMTIERRITFIVGEDGVAVWKLNRLKTLASYFRAVVILKNISNSRTSNAEKILSAVSLGCQPYHLCQLWIEGPDAELACMVLTDLVAELFDIVNPVRRPKGDPCDSGIKNHPAMLLPFPLNYRYLCLPAGAAFHKSALISRLSQMLDIDNAELICQSLFSREAISSTYIGHGIALPHVMVAGVKQPALAVVQLDSAIDWHARGNVHTVIAMLLPDPPSRSVIQSCTHLSRKLLDESFCQLVTQTKEAEPLQAILHHTLADAHRKVEPCS